MYVRRNVHSGFICDPGHWRESRCPSAGGGRSKLCPPTHRTLISHEKEQSADPCKSREGAWDYEATRKKANTSCMIPFM